MRNEIWKHVGRVHGLGDRKELAGDDRRSPRRRGRERGLDEGMEMSGQEGGSRVKV